MACLTLTSPTPELKFLRPFRAPPFHHPQLHVANSHQEPERTRRRLLRPQPCISAARRMNRSSGMVMEEEEEEEEKKVWALCGLGYWVQGFRCFPWLALNFHMVHGLRLSPSTLQLVQSSANLPLVAKPLFGVISDAIYIGGAHRIPYISIGVFLQIIAWGALALIPATGETFPAQMLCILLTNLGASLTEVVSDALTAEFSRAQYAGKLQSYALIALAAGAIFGNLSGGFILLKAQDPKLMFFMFVLLLTVQFVLSLTTKETSLYPTQCSSHHLVQNSLPENLSRQFSELMTAISEERIYYPLLWIVASIAVVPILSGAMFYFQTQCLNLDPSIIGLSKVFGQLVVLSATILYNRYLKRIPMRKLIFGVQMVYGLALLSDLVLVKQINLKLGISNEVYVLCLSALAEAVAQFKILPFTVLLTSLCPPGCECSLFAFFASALCLSSILGGILGVGLASIIGVSSRDHSSLPLGIILQCMASLVPLRWISQVPNVQNMERVKKKMRDKYLGEPELFP